MTAGEKNSGRERDNLNLIAELLTGSVIYNLVLFAAAAIFYGPGSVLTGLVVGMISTSLMLLHMAYTLDEVMEQENPLKAEKKMLLAVYSRKGVFLFFYLAVLMWFTEWINPFAVIAGAAGLKAGVWLRPFTARLLRHRQEEVRE